MSKVSVVKVRSNLEDEIERLIRLADGEHTVVPGDRVLLKPNIHGNQVYTTGGTTNPYVVAAVVKWAYKRGAKEVIVGEGPFYGDPHPEKWFTDTGMGEIVQQAGASWVTYSPEETHRLSRTPKEILDRYHPGAWDWFQEHGITLSPAPTRYENSKAKRILGWQPEYTFARWWEEHAKRQE